HSTEDPRFDRTQIDDLKSVIDEHNRAWRAWFAAARVRPYEIRYELLERSPRTTACGVLDHLGLEIAPGRAIEARHRRLADRVNGEWIARYRADTYLPIVPRSAKGSGALATLNQHGHSERVGDTPDLGVVIVNYETGAWLERCLCSLKRARGDVS